MNTELRKASAPYGQACTNCAKSKCRCLPYDGTHCERCRRLGKVCTPAAVRKRGKKQTASSRTSALENRLDDLVSMLRAKNTVEHVAHSTIATMPSGCSVDHHTDVAESTGHRLQEQDLLSFRERHLQFFPLIELSRETTAAQLQQEKPLLSLAIHVISTKTHAQQTLLAKELRAKLAQKISADGERNIDLLLSVLICIAWSLYATHSKCFLGSMMGLARPMVKDLQLDRSLASSCAPALAPPHLVGIDDTASRTDEGKRALIACFTLSVMISVTLKYDAMRWSPRLEDACRILSAADRSEGDRILVVLTRIARILLDASETAREASDDPTLAMQIAVAIRPLKSSLDLLKSTLTEEQLRHSTVNAYVHGTEAAIYELALIQPVGFASQESLNTNHTRMQHIASCLQACKIYTEAFLAVDLTHITTPSMLIFSHCLTMPYRLLAIQDHNWDDASVRAILDPTECLERATVEVDKANAVLKSETGGDSALKEAAEMMRAFLPQLRVPVRPNILVPNLSTDTADAYSIAADPLLMDFVDDFWLSGMLNL